MRGRTCWATRALTSRSAGPDLLPRPPLRGTRLLVAGPPLRGPQLAVVHDRLAAGVDPGGRPLLLETAHALRVRTDLRPRARRRGARHLTLRPPLRRERMAVVDHDVAREVCALRVPCRGRCLPLGVERHGG